VRRCTTGRPPAVTVGGLAPGPSAQTDNGGRYEVTGVAAGTYSAGASASGYGTQTQHGVVVSAGQTTTLDFVF
jgi:hypothetical protein